MTAEEKKLAVKENIKQAQKYLKNRESSFEDILKCAIELYDAQKFSYARRLLARLHTMKRLDDKLLSKWAISTYKDDDQPGETRYDEAIEILTDKHGADPRKIEKSRIAGNLGSIYKQKWRFDNQEIWLKTALCFLNRGYDLWMEAWKKEAPEIKINPAREVAPGSNFFDQGYCAINAAYVCDTLAARLREISEEDQTLKDISEQLIQRAKKIRRHIVAFCKGTEVFFKQRWSKDNNEEHSQAWFYTTWAEALMGLGTKECTKAIEKIKEAIKNRYFDPNSWSGDSAAHQITNWIAEDHFGGNREYSDQAQELLKTISGATTFGSRNDRIGLALSGGGFRAALFHIGVLARLAEQNLLHKIEVISCVSGGSIIGAYYYLEVRNKLQEKPDSKIEQIDYIEIVQKIEKEFLQVISVDLRSNLFSNVGDNIRMAFDPDYSRTTHLADQYEKHLYSKLLDKVAESKKATEKSLEKTTDNNIAQAHSNLSNEIPFVDTTIYMSDLLISPMGENGELMTDISPKHENWKRRNKIPMLVLNATTLNTGHCWQFTASWMGEPPSYINNETDALPTLRRMYYEEAPAPHNKIKLSTAVAASSCVPVLFRPIQLREIYKPENGELIDVELVDGGVYDNQGINTLLEQECNTIIISDASGQLASVNEPKSGLLSVSGRTNAILQERIRAGQLSDLNARYGSKILKGYLLMHLTKGLPSEVVNWRDCNDPYEPNFRSNGWNNNSLNTDFGIPKSIQFALARIRTDLDAFHDQEAYSLMYSGYQMTEFEIQKVEKNNKMQNGSRKSLSPFYGERVSPDKPWTFKCIGEIKDDSNEFRQLKKLLGAAANILKVHLVSNNIKIFLGILALLVLGIFKYWLDGVVKMPNLAILVIFQGFALLWLGYYMLMKKQHFNPFRAALGILPAFAAGMIIYFFSNRLNVTYLRAGKWKPRSRETDTKQT